MLKRAKAKHSMENTTYVQAAAERLPFKGCRFDRVICSLRSPTTSSYGFACFPHFAKKGAALAEIARTLTKDGILVIAHAAGREKINTMHASIGGVLSRDLIPTNAEMHYLLEQA